MAGIQWTGGKLTMQKAGALRVHLGQEDRVKREHSNPDINKNKSHLNYCIGCKDYEDAYQSMRKRVKEVDAKNPPKRLKSANQRIVAMSLIAYCPQAIVEQGKEDEFFQELHGVYQDFLGKDLHGQFVHKDEIHQYVDPQTHETKTSLPHSHTLVSAYAEWVEKDTKTGEVRARQGINGKNFSSTSRINQLNAAVDKMCREKFGVPYVTGAGKKKGKTVEQLKIESEIEALNDIADVAKDAVQNLLDKKDKILDEIEELGQQRDSRVVELASIPPQPQLPPPLPPDEPRPMREHRPYSREEERELVKAQKSYDKSHAKGGERWQAEQQRKTQTEQALKARADWSEQHQPLIAAKNVMEKATIKERELANRERQLQQQSQQMQAELERGRAEIEKSKRANDKRSREMDVEVGRRVQAELARTDKFQRFMATSAEFSKRLEVLYKGADKCNEKAFEEKVKAMQKKGVAR